jgi:predicted  nucleic acid-binding Zn-ribbon protein
VLGLLDRLDPARAAVSELEAQRADAAGLKAELEAVITAEWRQIDAELARKEERKKEALTPIPPDLVEMYEKLRHSKEGVAIGRYEHGVCGGCHMALSPAEEVEALGAEIPRCVHCRRILVA